MDNPSKKRRIDLKRPDFEKCIICQEIKSDELLVQNITDDAYKNVLHYVVSRAAYGDVKLIEASKLLDGLSETDLKHNNARFHASCRKWLVNAEKLKRAKVRFEKAAESQNTSLLIPQLGRPSLEPQPSTSTSCDDKNSTGTSRRVSRSSTPTYNKQLCFFCQTHDEKQPLHAIQNESRGKQLSDFVQNCDNDLFKVFLNSAIRPEDALSIDVQYHRTCWTKYVVRGQEIKSKNLDSVPLQNKIAADVEFLNLINNLLSKGKILELNEAHHAYQAILDNHFCEISPCRKAVSY